MTDTDNPPVDNALNEEGHPTKKPLTGMIGQAWLETFAEEITWEGLVEWLREAD
jgi:hypothetical protein